MLDKLGEVEVITVNALAPLVELWVAPKPEPNPVNEMNVARTEPGEKTLPIPIHWDLPALFIFMEKNWYRVWTELKKRAPRNSTSGEFKAYTVLLRELRHRGRHRPKTDFSEKDALRFVSIAEQFLRAAGADAEADRVNKIAAAQAATNPEDSIAQLLEETRNLRSLVTSISKSKVKNPGPKLVVRKGAGVKFRGYDNTEHVSVYITWEAEGGISGPTRRSIIEIAKTFGMIDVLTDSGEKLDLFLEYENDDLIAQGDDETLCHMASIPQSRSPGL